MGKRGPKSSFDHRAQSILRLAYERGCTDEEASGLCGVTVQTIHNWRKANPETFEVLKDWKAQADGRVELSLYEKALGGHFVRETRVVKDKDGEIVERVETIKQVPPDTTSMIFWLKNRQPDQWRDRQQVDHNAQVQWHVITGIERRPIKTIEHQPIEDRDEDGSP